MINIQSIVERIREIINDENSRQLKETLEGFHAADLVDIFAEITPQERLACFKQLDEDKASDLLEYLPAQLQVELLGEIDEELASRLIAKMPHDEAADVLGDMEEDESESYLDKLPHKFSSEVRELLTYNEESAGGIMNPVVLTVNAESEVKDVLDTIRIKAEKDNLDLYYVYVVDKQSHLLGVASLRKLLTSPVRRKITEIMTTDIVRLHVDDRQDYIADEFMKYQFNALPVVDLYNRLKGIVTWDDVQDIVEEETTEEIYTSSGIATEMVEDEDDILSGNLLHAVKARTPWLFITLIGEFAAVNVAHHFDYTLKFLSIIAIFMPLLTGLGGNIGTQSITLIVRGLSTGQLSLKSAFHHILRETAIGLIIGILFGTLVTLVTWGWQHSVGLGIVVGFSMIVNMMCATLIGTCIPFVLKKINIDPAIASGPVITTTIDVVGLLIYFNCATVYLLHIR
ncbi:MAG: magnesium transporter [Candidatus Gastranaerophilales bacterium]|nr:magnesium transporter [Candidatus Gastranaerophilales bacterium]